MVALAEYPIGSIRFVVIYGPPSSQIKAFLEGFANLLGQFVPISGAPNENIVQNRLNIALVNVF